MLPSVQHGHPCDMAACAIWSRVQYGHLCNTATCAIRPLVQYGRLCNMAVCTIWPPVRYGHPCNMATCAIQYGHSRRPHPQAYAHLYTRTPAHMHDCTPMRMATPAQLCPPLHTHAHAYSRTQRTPVHMSTPTRLHASAHIHIALLHTCPHLYRP